MITVRVCDKNDRKQFERFVESGSTTTFVHVPSGKQAQLLAFSPKPGFHACIEIDGAEVVCVSLDEAQTDIEIPKPPKPTRSELIIRGIFGGSRAPVKVTSELTVLVRRDSAEGQVVGTYKFHLLDSLAFAATLERKIQESADRSVTPPVVYTTDHHLPGGRVPCWNCGAPLTAECCTGCGSCPDGTQV